MAQQTIGFPCFRKLWEKRGGSRRPHKYLAPLLALLWLLIHASSVHANRLEWVRDVGPLGEVNDSTGVAVDSEGVYVVGRTRTKVNGRHTLGYTAGYLIHFDLQGQLQWSRQFRADPDCPSNTTEPFGVALDSDAIYVVGRHQSNCRQGAFISRFNRNGLQTWRREIPGMAEARKVRFHRGHAYVCGDAVIGTSEGPGVAVVAVDPEGNLGWQQGPASQPALASCGDLAVDRNFIYVASDAVREFDLQGNLLRTFAGQNVAANASGVHTLEREGSGSTSYRVHATVGGDGSSLEPWIWTQIVPPSDPSSAVLVSDNEDAFVIATEEQSVLDVFHFNWTGDLQATNRYEARVRVFDAAMYNGQLFVAGGQIVTGRKIVSGVKKIPLEPGEEADLGFLAAYAPGHEPVMRSLGSVAGKPAVALLKPGNRQEVLVDIYDVESETRINRIDFGEPWLSDIGLAPVPQDMLVVPDMNGNGVAEVALLTLSDGYPVRGADIRDALTGEQLRVIPFDREFAPVRFSLVPDVGRAGNPGLVVLGRSINDNRLRAEVVELASGDQSAVVPFSGNGDLLFAVMPDVSGNEHSELVLGQRTQGPVDFVYRQVGVKDGASGDVLAYLDSSSGWHLRDVVALPDLNASGSADLGLLELVNTIKRLVKLRLYDGADFEQFSSISFGSVREPVQAILLGDTNGNGSPELGVLAVNEKGDADSIEVRDLGSKKKLTTLTFPYAGYFPRGVTVLPELSGPGKPGVGQLQKSNSGGPLRGLFLNAGSGETVREIFFDDEDMQVLIEGRISSNDGRGVTLPVAASRVIFETWGGTGNVDLYVRGGREGACASEHEGNAESCVFTNVPAQRFFRMQFKSSSGTGGVRFRVRYAPQTSPVGNSVTVLNEQDLASSTSLRRRLEIPAGVTRLTFETSGGVGKVDLYVRSGAKPTQSNYTCSSTTGSGRCQIDAPVASGAWHVLLKAGQDWRGTPPTFRVSH